MRNRVAGSSDMPADYLTTGMPRFGLQGKGKKIIAARNANCKFADVSSLPAN